MLAGMKITVTAVKKPSGKTQYRVRYPADGKIRRKFFDSRDRAEGFANQRRRIHDAAGLDAANIPSGELREIVDLRARLAEYGATIREAAEEYLRRAEAAAARTGVSIGDAIDRFSAERERGRARARTVQSLRTTLQAFAAGRSAASLSNFTPEDAEDFIFDETNTPRTQINRRLRLLAFFKWAAKRGIADNIVAGIDPPRTDAAEPVILSNEQTRRLLHAAAAHARPNGPAGEFVPYHALALFAGIRPAEMSRLTWEAINLRSETISITGRAAKLRARRTIPIPANAMQWLEPHAAARTPILPPGPQKNLQAIREAAGIVPWPQDAARHTCISAWMSLHGETKAAAWAGNSPAVCHAHYKGMMDERTARAFFEIHPDDGEIAAIACGEFQ